MADPDGATPPPIEGDVFSRACASREIFQHVTGRWGALVVVALGESESAMRFAQLRRRVDGVSDRMLSQTLAQLERDGVVVRTVRSSIPPHVDYVLTSLGRAMAGPLSDLTTIIESELPQVFEARQAYGAADPARA